MLYNDLKPKYTFEIVYDGIGLAVQSKLYGLWKLKRDFSTN